MEETLVHEHVNGIKNSILSSYAASRSSNSCISLKTRMNEKLGDCHCPFEGLFPMPDEVPDYNDLIMWEEEEGRKDIAEYFLSGRDLGGTCRFFKALADHRTGEHFDFCKIYHMKPGACLEKDPAGEISKHL